MAILRAGFKNNINIMAVRSNGAVTDIVTDRPIDVTGDGVNEQTSVVTVEGEGNKVVQTVTRPAGVGRTVIKSTTEPDGGSLDDRGRDFTEGLE
jgi:hypothetical protein